MNHDAEGMTEKEFGLFAECLPASYQKRFARLGTFDKLSNNKGIIEYADFELVLDVFAEMVVDDVDIDVTVLKEDISSKTPLPETNLMSPSSFSEQFSTEYDSNDDEEDKGGFFSKLAIWRNSGKQLKKMKSSASISRRILIGSKTPTTGGSSFAA